MKIFSKAKEIFEAWAISFNPDHEQAELAQERILICNTCENKVLEPYIHCGLCGCALKAKIYTPKTFMDEGGSCPAKKWMQVETEYLNKFNNERYNKLNG